MEVRRAGRVLPDGNDHQAWRRISLGQPGERVGQGDVIEIEGSCDLSNVERSSLLLTVCGRHSTREGIWAFTQLPIHYQEVETSG